MDARDQFQASLVTTSVTTEEDSELLLGSLVQFTTQDSVDEVRSISVELRAVHGQLELQNLSAVVLNSAAVTGAAALSFVSDSSLLSQALTDNVMYTPGPGFHGRDMILVQLTTYDSGDVILSQSLDVMVTATTDAVGVVAPSVLAVDEDGAVALTGTHLTLAGVPACECDVNDHNFLGTLVSLVVVSTEGTLACSDSLADAVQELSSTRLQVTGSPQAVDAVLSTLTFTPATDFNGEATVDISVTNIAADQSATTTIVIAVAAIDDPPTIAFDLCANVLATEDTATYLGGASIVDTDASSTGLYRVSLSARYGTLALNSAATPGVEFIEGNAESSSHIKVNGVLDDIRALLQNITYLSLIHI